MLLLVQERRVRSRLRNNATILIVKLTHKIVKEGKAIFVSDEKTCRTVIETLRTSFFFVAGNAKPIEAPFPYTMEELSAKEQTDNKAQ